MLLAMVFMESTAQGGALRGNEAFTTLYEHYHEPVLRYLYQLSGSWDQAEELAQETFVRAYTGRLTFRGNSSVATWLFRIARNTYLNSRRRQRPAELDTTEFHAIPDTTQHADPVQHYAAGEQRDRIGLALRELPEEQRSILLLRDAAGLAYGEIAQVLGLSVAAVRIRLFRARNAFRTIYRSLEGDEGGDDARL